MKIFEKLKFEMRGRSRDNFFEVPRPAEEFFEFKSKQTMVCK